METYYSSDWHIGHWSSEDRNIIKYCNRPFRNTDEMDKTILDNHKARLKKGDRLYLVGDVSFHPQHRTAALLRELKQETQATFYLVPGNHDSKELERLRDWDDDDAPRFWEDVSPLMDVRDRKRKVVLCHYKMEVFNRSHRGAYQLFGHSHNSMPGNTQQIDVGVDCWDFRPVTLDECIARMKTLKPFRQADYHDG